MLCNLLHALQAYVTGTKITDMQCIQNVHHVSLACFVSDIFHKSLLC